MKQGRLFPFDEGEQPVASPRQRAYLSTFVEVELFVRLLGVEMTLQLIELHGGRRVFVPLRAAPTQKLARELSPEAERALAAEFGGIWVSIPTAKAWCAALYAARGLGVREIAGRLRLSERQVYQMQANRRRAQG